MRLMLRSSLSFLLLAVLLLWMTPGAWAHAVLQKSTPAASSTVSGEGLVISLTYNSRIDAAHSSLSLMGDDGKTLPLKVDAKAEPNVLRSEAASCKPGHYSVHWQVVASDGHISRGAIPFNVR